MITPCVVGVLHLHLGRDGVCYALHVDEGVLHHARHAGIDCQRLAPAHQVGTSGDRRVEALGASIVDRQHVVADRLLHEDRLQLLQLLRMLLGQVVRLAEVLDRRCRAPTRRPSARVFSRSYPTGSNAGCRPSSRHGRCRDCRTFRSTASSGDPAALALSAE